MRRFLFVLGLLAASPAMAQTADEVNAAIAGIFGESVPFAAAFEALQTAVAAGDEAAVAALVAYPITVRPGGTPIEVATPEAFIADYAAIVTDAIREVVTGQTYETLFVNQDGVMFGSGEVWLSGVCKDDACAAFDVKVIAIQSGAE